MKVSVLPFDGDDPKLLLTVQLHEQKIRAWGSDGYEQVAKFNLTRRAAEKLMSSIQKALAAIDE